MYIPLTTLSVFFIIEVACEQVENLLQYPFTAGVPWQFSALFSGYDIRRETKWKKKVMVHINTIDVWRDRL